MRQEKPTKKINVTLDAEGSDLLEQVKAHLGLRTDAETVRYVMTYYARAEGLVAKSSPGEF